MERFPLIGAKFVVGNTLDAIAAGEIGRTAVPAPVIIITVLFVIPVGETFEFIVAVDVAAAVGEVVATKAPAVAVVVAAAATAAAAEDAEGEAIVDGACCCCDELTDLPV